MEHISAQLEKMASQPDSTKSLQVLNKTLNLERDEIQIVELKYKSKQFGEMNLSERTKWTKGLIAKIAVITGWVVPLDAVLNILIDQFEKKLNETYPNYNPDEVEYAFRERGTKLKDWGKEINLSLIDEVMVPYMEKRFEVSQKEEQKKSRLMLPEITEDISDEGMDKFWDATEALVSKGYYPIELIPPMLYDWMDKNGNILKSREEKLKYVERATLVRHTAISIAYEKNPRSLETKAALYEFNKMRETKEFSVSEKEKITDLAKKMIVFEMMKAKLSK